MYKSFSLQRCWLFVLLLLLPLGVAAKHVWTVDELPVPYLQDRTQYVSNPDQILKPAIVRELNALLYKLEQDKGVQSLVVVVDRVAGGDPYEFGMALGRKYGVGSKAKRTGLIVILAKGDRAYHFLTGNGLEATLPDALVQRIEDNIFLPRLKQQDWDGAMLAALQAIDRICRGDESLTKSLETNTTKEPSAIGGIALLFLGMSFAAIVYYGHRLKKRPRPCPRCGQKTYRWERDRQGHTYRGGHRYLITTATYRCSHCGYTDNDRKENRDDNNHSDWVNAVLLTALFGGRGSGSGFGGGSSGGSFGGGSFGGGGSGGRF